MRLQRVVTLTAVAISCTAPARPSVLPTPDAAAATRASLDHVYIVLDSSTFAAIANSDFLKSRVASVQARTTVANGGQAWSGIYIQGLHTYVELFPPASGFGSPGSAGVAFSVSAQGDADTLKASLQRLGATPTITFRTGLRDGQQQPWFYSLRPWSDSTSMARWVMEYHPDFVRWEGSDSALADGRTFRRRIPRRRHDPALPLVDVVGVTISMPAWDASRLRRELGAMGWSVRPSLESTVGFTALGPDCTLHVNVSEAPARITVLDFSLRDLNLAQGRTPLGARSVFHVRDRRATWSF